ncbi:MAG: peptidoglycan DD-metalloendopeptidase family protein [Thiobacillus sp.]
MFFAHIPAGYLAGRAVLRGNQPGSNQPDYLKWILVAGMTGGGFPDIDLLYSSWFDATPQHHHTYWTHLPIAWLGCVMLAWGVSRNRSVSIRLGLATFFAAWLSHLMLDSIAGDIWWLYPYIDQPFSLVSIQARHQPWWMNYLLHWTMALELLIITFAVGLEVKSPRLGLRYALPRPITLLGPAVMGLILLESIVSDPVLRVPVQGASHRDWNPDSYWHPNWGVSGVHKGIDIFSAHGTPVLAAQDGLVVYSGTVKNGGKVIAVLSARGWLNYYAHLDHFAVSAGRWVKASETLGFVGNTGNAYGKPAHLHYSIVSPIPRPLSFRAGPQGWRRLFYRDPNALLKTPVAISATLASEQPRPRAAAPKQPHPA